MFVDLRTMNHWLVSWTGTWKSVYFPAPVAVMGAVAMTRPAGEPIRKSMNAPPVRLQENIDQGVDR
jgi:hypothetical protein